MIFSITGFGYLLLTFGLGILACRCFESTYQNGGGKTGKLFAYFFTNFSLTTLVLSCVSLLGNFPQVVRYLLFFKDILFALGCGILGYLILYFKFPELNPWYGFVPIFLIGIIALFTDIFFGHPFVTKTGGINWGLPIFGDFLPFFMFLTTFLPMSVILYKQSKDSKEQFLKTKAFLFALIALGGFLVAFVEMILEPFFNLEEMPINETVLIILNTVLFTFLFTSQKDFKKEG